MAETITQASPSTKVELTAGSTSSPIYTPGSCVIICIPGVGGTMLAEATWSPRADVEAGSATWFDWDSGAVTEASNQLLRHATAVRFTATTADGVGEVKS